MSSRGDQTFLRLVAAQYSISSMPDWWRARNNRNSWRDRLPSWLVFLLMLVWMLLIASAVVGTILVISMLILRQ
ncbi:MAG: hypothetical protein C5B60_07425 [Chloroflexi bacterium]|nr:MAG: hypothetical protein C5B60_07425 [Chloroflexota bacterium]